MTFSSGAAPSKNLTRATEGDVQISEFPDLKFSKMEIDEEAFTTGEEVFNPSTGTKEWLAGEPSLGQLTLTTPESPAMRAALERLVQQGKADPRKIITIAHRKAGQTRLYQGRLGTARVDTGFDKDSELTNVPMLTLQISLTKREPLT